ncbi:histidinolphosphatase [Saccharomyces cerevisiae]|uniref:Histidinol-phosphatase n=2 Tax=Saccharomyces TaxID=4930 RepID=G2WDG3_YEASK|nr:His2p [Saccharomyces cerevisiae YJM1307]AJV23408.1 His2p [Saccharomyces cerevisiae YJM1388]AJV23510.1 His2p [Saccharomyces cerevisiae YJM1389]AJV23825.1 His2p [Saccharomyces cerevisiae YJM1401]AJV24343.1 His2p [Saccharomyces cerevisiae YJM1419]AJV25153.1 His2p [Saccharomyces cerevisiae YJM1460]AJV26174.1 His2p [Saccharomyces cerevisiae YJM1592]QID79356.1 histidinolphosphatase [Saccharomyces pastorianus]CAI4442522.1 CLN_G0017440.mRNA.1.CDS.1 [Saccharomyces cerevisiae]GAA23106.1 K7_His2p 
MHSHHSHSGDYSAHGTDPLDSVVDQVVNLNFHTYCLTEHIPRIEAKFIYPEEQSLGKNPEEVITKLETSFKNFMSHAQEIKTRYADRPDVRTKFIIGMEIESCDMAHIEYAKRLMKENNDILKFCVGSVHHVNGIAIDFDQQQWYNSLHSFNDNLKDFLLSYFQSQYEMLINIKPLVVGHFDLYKLFLPNDMLVNQKSGNCNEETGVPVASLDVISEWPEIYDAVVRNLQFIDSYGGAIEINTSALRKGLEEPYPSKTLCNLVKKHCGSRFVLSDDAHGVAQVGVCYDKVKKYIVDVLQLEYICYLEESQSPENVLTVKRLPISQFVNDPFWANI